MDKMQAKAVLDTLMILDGNGIEERTLRQYVNNRLAVMLSPTEARELFMQMKAAGYIGKISDEFGEKYFIVESGRFKQVELSRL